MVARWFVFQLLPNEEKKASFHLKRQSFNHFFPHVVNVDRDGVEIFTPLFSGYGFVLLDMEVDRWRSVNGTRGVVGLLPKWRETPTPMMPGFVEELLSHDPIRIESIRKLLIEYLPGTSIEVTNGIFKGYKGEVLEMRGPRIEVLLMSLMGQKRNVLIPVNQIKVSEKEEDGGLFYREDCKKESRLLVNEFHYSHLSPSVISYCGSWHEKGGLFGNFGPIVACAMFNPPVGGGSESLFRNTPMLELKRLCRHPNRECLPLSGLIAIACRRIKELGLADLLISYADIEQDHHGGIYQASSWNYTKMVAPSSGNYKVINGKKFGTRGLNHVFGTQRIDILQERMPSATIEKYIDEGKHMYWRALTKKGQKQAEVLGFVSIPYPKPNVVVESMVK